MTQIVGTEPGPIYRTIGESGIDNNPLVAHLRLPPESDDDAILALGLHASFNPAERELPTSIRRIRIDRLRRFFIPVHPVHRRALSGIITQMFASYEVRNPMTPQGQEILYGGSTGITFCPTISFVAGYSGMGKSTLMNRILGYAGNQVVQHTAFRGESFPERQILHLRRNIPEYCTPGILYSTFGDYTDRILRTKLYSRAFFRARDQVSYLQEIRKIITNHHVGLLVLDEFQNLSLMGVGAKKIISLLVNLREEIGVPIVVVGTYKALGLLEGDMSASRRLCEGGYFDLERPLSYEDEAWNLLCGAAWNYQWIRNPIDYSSEIAKALYEVSQGITGIMLSVLATAQLAAMEEDGGERVDAHLIRKVYDERMKPLHPAIRILQSGDPRLMSKFDDLYKNAYPAVDSKNDEIHAGKQSAEAETVNGLEAQTPGKPNARKPSKSVRRIGHTAVTSSLTEEQLNKLVTDNSIKDLIYLLDRP